MDKDTIVVAKIKAQLSKFSGIISKGYSAPKRRLIREVLYGIQATKDVKLSNIGRSLREEQALVKTEDRLSRNLDDVDFTEGINREICRLGGSKVLDDMVIALDPGDIRKRYARKMEYLCGIYDGSENRVGRGYWLLKCVAADIEHTRVIPLYCEAWSQEAEDFLSENIQLFRAIDTVGRYVGSRGIWAIDRTGDRNAILEKFLGSQEPKRFVIRLTSKRDLVHRGGAKNCRKIAEALPCHFSATLITYQEGKEKKRTVFYNGVKVKLAGRGEGLFLVVVKGFGQEPMMLLTNCQIHLRRKEAIWRIVEIYLTRWKCDESYRYIKQSYNLEDIRVRTYTAIRNLVVLVLAVSYFAAVYLGQNLKLKILVERIFLVSKRFFGVPSFFNYAMADGLHNLLFPDKTGLKTKRGNTEDFQLCFSFW
ncbi:MAG: hypothetical protein ACE5OR_14850 [bacterium]